MRKATAMMTGMALAVAMAIPAQATAQTRFMEMHDGDKLAKCMGAGLPLFWCRMTESERRTSKDWREVFQYTRQYNEDKNKAERDRKARKAAEWSTFKDRRLSEGKEVDPCKFDGGC